MPGLSCGIVGLPNVGKSTLFNAVTKAGAAVANYPFCTIEPNIGVVAVPDSRLESLATIEGVAQRIHATIEYVDIAGLVKGASKGEGRGNQFLQHIHHVDALVHVVRCFDDAEVAHVSGAVDPVADAETINFELILADLETAERAIAALAKRGKSGDADARRGSAAMARIHAHLSEGRPVRTLTVSAREWQAVQDWRFLTAKPVIYLANADEANLPELDGPAIRALREYALTDGAPVLPVCARLEDEIAQLEPEEAAEFLADLGLSRSALERLIRTSYEALGLITFFTTNDREARAWTIHRGTTAPGAAGVIHSDFERGFIRAEVIPFETVARRGSRAAAKEAGEMRLEGHDYVVQDGDVMFFRFSV